MHVQTLAVALVHRKTEAPDLCPPVSANYFLFQLRFCAAMGFRFQNLNSIHKTLVSRISSHTHGTLLQTPNFPNSTTRSFNPQSYDPSSIFPHNPIFRVPKRWHFGHSHNHHDHQHHHSSEVGESIFRLGLFADIGLVTGKALTGYLSGSTAIIADAAHSASDVVLSGVALWSYKVAKAPKDKEHPYGHGKFETLGALGISCMLLATAGGIAWHAVDVLLGVLSAAPEVINHSLAHEHVHSHHHSGHHHGIDVDHPVLALRGSILGVKFLDPLAGLVVSGMILKAGLGTGYQSVMELVDAAVPVQQLDPIKETILQVDGVKGCHRLRGRRAGSSLYLDVHIEVDPFSSVSAAHNVGENVRHQIHKSHPGVSEVFIHIDPAISQISPSIMEQQENLKEMNYQKRNVSSEHNGVEIVSNVLSSKFSEKMVVERITQHLLQGNTLLQVEVSMPPHILIRDAMRVAEEAEEEILKVASDVIRVSILLRLGQPIPELHQRLQECNTEKSQNTHP
ncbi:metal tolerance protein 2 isoform X2 [Vitis riparia]|uniref:metal tolerance protein 2 isoform X2 n=1 Tax=Vitis riparia TaxID=96939 RepID=UPI00155A1310|nr:metal tolerance protein 2 isoform X2 [Vitis riparia]